MNRRNTTKRPPCTSTLCTVIEALESRAMLAGVGTESWSAAGLAPAPLGTGSLFSSGIILTCSSPAPGSSGTASPPAPTAGTGGSQSTGLALPSNSGSGTGSSPTGGGSSNSGGLALPSNSGSGAGSSHSDTGSTSDPNNPVLSSRYNGGSNAGGQGNGTNSSGTLSGSDLWLSYGAGSGSASSSAGASSDSTSSFLALLSQSKEGSSAGGQGNGTVSPLTNAELWRLYWSGAGAGSSSSSSDEGSLADDPTISAQYTGGSGIGRITPLVYNPESDGPPGFHSGVWTGDVGGIQFVQVTDTGSGKDGGNPPAGRPTPTATSTDDEQPQKEGRETPLNRPGTTPKDLPDGTRPIDKIPEMTRELIHKIKEQLKRSGEGVGANTWVGIDSDGNVWVPDPNGRGENLGGWQTWAEATAISGMGVIIIGWGTGIATTGVVGSGVILADNATVIGVIDDPLLVVTGGAIVIGGAVTFVGGVVRYFGW